MSHLAREAYADLCSLVGDDSGPVLVGLIIGIVEGLVLMLRDMLAHITFPEKRH